jgi:hypothetical protein
MNEWDMEEDNCGIKVFLLGMLFGIALLIIFSGYKSCTI